VFGVISESRFAPVREVRRIAVQIERLARREQLMQIMTASSPWRKSGKWKRSCGEKGNEKKKEDEREEK